MSNAPSSTPRLCREYWAAPSEPRLRARVNDPLVSTGKHADRDEAAANGLVLIETDVPLRDVVAAELVLELWGGHPHTTAKRVTLNGHNTYPLPADGTELGHCSYSFPVVPISVTDLVRGTNVLQFACDRGVGVWGHFIVDNAALRLYLNDSVWPVDPAGFGVKAAGWEDDRIAIEPRLPPGIDADSLVVEALHLGYGCEGRFEAVSWGLHSGTKDRSAYGALETMPAGGGALAARSPSLLGQPLASAVRVTARIGETLASAWSGPCYGPAVGSTMTAALDPPVPFWSRAGKIKQTSFLIPADLLGRTASVRMHARFWNGGAGTVPSPVLLNNLPVAFDLEGAPHDLCYEVVEIPPDTLRPGTNSLTLTSDTEHHGIEMLLPGPVLECVPHAR